MGAVRCGGTWCVCSSHRVARVHRSELDRSMCGGVRGRQSSLHIVTSGKARKVGKSHGCGAVWRYVVCVQLTQGRSGAPVRARSEHVRWSARPAKFAPHSDEWESEKSGKKSWVRCGVAVRGVCAAHTGSLGCTGPSSIGACAVECEAGSMCGGVRGRQSSLHIVTSGKARKVRST